jgi:hypothetical protein
VRWNAGASLVPGVNSGVNSSSFCVEGGLVGIPLCFVNLFAVVMEPFIRGTLVNFNLSSMKEWNDERCKDDKKQLKRSFALEMVPALRVSRRDVFSEVQTTSRYRLTPYHWHKKERGCGFILCYK